MPIGARFAKLCTDSLLLANGASAGFIIPNPWLTNLRQQATRRYICEMSSIHEIVHFKFPVFHGAVVDTQVVHFRKPLERNNVVSVFTASAVNSENELLLDLVAEHKQEEWIKLDGGVAKR